MNVSLTPELEAQVDEKVQSGLYHTASEVVRDAQRLLRERDELQARRMEALCYDMAIGLQQLDAGEAVPLNRKSLEGIKTRGKAKLAERAEGSIGKCRPKCKLVRVLSEYRDIQGQLTPICT